jgi:hypothetical protein
MKRLGVSPRPDGVAGGHVDEPIVGVPRVGDVMIEIGVVLALHLAVAFAVIMTLRAFGNG